MPRRKLLGRHVKSCLPPVATELAVDSVMAATALSGSRSSFPALPKHLDTNSQDIGILVGNRMQFVLKAVGYPRDRI